MPRQPYHHRRERKPWGRHATFERVVSAIVLLALIVVLILFLFVYHDIPLRTS